MYKLGQEKTIIISTNVKKIFDKYSSMLPSNEAGGILLGRICLNDCIVIEEITEPTEKDKSGYYFFERDRETAQDVIGKRWESSKGKLIYLGEWHTHNEPVPTPSYTDKKMIKDLLIQSKMEIDFLITIIVGMKTNFIGLQNGRNLRQIKESNNPFIYSIND